MLPILDENFDDQIKIKLLGYYTGNLSIKDKTYSDSLKLYIIEHHLFPNDIFYLIENYSFLSEIIKAKTRSLMCKFVLLVLTSEIPFPKCLITDIINDNNITIEIRFQIFVSKLQYLEENLVKDALLKLEKHEYLSLLDGKKPKFEINNINEKLLNFFKEKEWLTKFEVDKKDEKSYRAHGKRKNGEIEQHETLITESEVNSD